MFRGHLCIVIMKFNIDFKVLRFYPFSKLHSVRLFIIAVFHSDSRLFGTQILFE